MYAFIAPTKRHEKNQMISISSTLYKDGKIKYLFASASWKDFVKPLNEWKSEAGKKKKLRYERRLSNKGYRKCMQMLVITLHLQNGYTSICS